MTKLKLSNLSSEEKIQIVKKGYDEAVRFANEKKESLKLDKSIKEEEMVSIEMIYKMTIDSVNAASSTLISTIIEEPNAALESMFVAQTMAIKELYLEEKGSLSEVEVKALSLFCAGHFEVITYAIEYIIESNKYEYDEDLMVIHALATVAKEYVITDSTKGTIDSKLKEVLNNKNNNIEKLKDLLSGTGLGVSDIKELSGEEIEAKLRQSGKDVKVVEINVDSDIADDRDKVNKIITDVVRKVIKEEKSEEKSKKVKQSIREELEKAKSNKEESDLSFGDKLIKVYKENIINIK